MSNTKNPGGVDSPAKAGGGPGFVHLHTHSAYSLLEGAVPLSKLVDLAYADGQPALAVTDRNNLFGALEFSEKASGKGIQPIMGAKVAVDFGDGADRKPRSGLVEFGCLILLAMDSDGFSNLSRLVSKAHLDSGAEKASGPHVLFADLVELNHGLIVLTGGPDGPVDRLAQDGHLPQARTRVEALHRVFGDRLYVELQRHAGDQRTRRTEPFLIDTAFEIGLPLVATNEPYFAQRADFEAHDALIAIAEGTVVNVDDRRKLTPDHYFKSRAEMAVLFADLPEALESTVEIARRCAFRAKKHNPILPRFTGESSDPEAAFMAETGELKRQAREGLAARMAVFDPAPGFTRSDYDQRLEFELSV
ncbi:MAG TPA: PHP domain-containing protein, partial [Rhizobiaceae bacterium]|nr:PHP domain-containing protein [Rhizobiaceae bacterium]